MVLLFFIVAGLMFAFITGGRLKNLETCPVRHWWLPIASALAESFGRMAASRWEFLPSEAFILAQYLLLFTFVLVNCRADWSVLIFGGGTLANFIVIAANGFRMPVLTELADRMNPDLAASLKSGEIFGYALAHPDSPLLFLGDVFYLPVPLFYGFASIGDFLIGIGAFLICVVCLKGRRKEGRHRRRLDAEDIE